MSILRLSTLSLIFAIAVMTLGYNPSFADKPGSGPCLQKHCDHGEEDTSGLTYTVDLIGISGMRGAFEFEDRLVDTATLQFKGTELKGDAAVTMKRAGDDPTCVTVPAADDQSACMVWNDVFDLCGLLGPVGGPTDFTEFTVQLGDWGVGQGGDREGINFGFELDSPLSDNPLSASLHLFGTCTSPCGTIPTTAVTKIVFLTNFQVHLKGKRGVTSQAECHGDMGLLAASGSTLVITASSP